MFTIIFIVAVIYGIVSAVWSEIKIRKEKSIIIDNTPWRREKEKTLEFYYAQLETLESLQEIYKTDAKLTDEQFIKKTYANDQRIFGIKQKIAKLEKLDI